jgi:hypothetical protein
MICSLTMSAFKFRVVVVKDSTPQEWLRLWSGRYPPDDEPEYRDLIANYGSLSADEFERIGKWKDGVGKSTGRWMPNVASVAYLIWMQAAQKPPKCPEEDEVEAFLDGWSGRTYTDVFPNKSVEKHFGLSRATTLLHFVSGGRYPIFDARVRTAIGRLLGSSVPPYTVRWYLESCCPLFRELAALCETGDDLRNLDKALFSYGAFEGFHSQADPQPSVWL